MRVLFIVLLIFCGTALIGLLIMLLGFGVRINLRFHLKEGKTIPIQQLIPQTVYGWFTFVVSFSAVGLIVEQFLPQWYLLLPICIVFAMMINLIGVHFLLPMLKRFYYGEAPEITDLEGEYACVMENIPGTEYGRCKVKYGGRTYFYDCIPVYHTDLEKNEKVLILTGQDNLLFVQKQSEIYEIFKQEG